MDMPIVLLDACVLINLCATELVKEIALANGVTFGIVSEVASESLYVDIPGVHGLDRMAIDVNSLELMVLELDGAELETFIAFAGELDDGEAATLAAALHRHLHAATDDRRALRFVQDRALAVEIVRTSDLIHRWANYVNADRAEVATILKRVREGAHFQPNPDDPHANWWREIIT
jgi:hypothetical protein